VPLPTGMVNNFLTHWLNAES